jgi:DNA-binding CsgD family transcriptional regulator
VPATVRDATLARTRRLEPDARRVLGAAAVIGQEIPLDLLREVADADADAIEECVSHGVLVEAGATLTFRHELIRQAVEEGTSSVRKQDLHARVLEALKERDAPAARLAHHAEQAGLADQAGEYAATAAQEAVEVGAHLDAARQYERALAHGESTGKERVQLQIGFGYTAWMAGRSEPAVSVLTEAVAEAERLGDDALLARALDRQSVALWEVDRMAESREAQERAVAVIEHGDDDAALSRALSGLVSMLSVGIDPDAAIAEAPRALAQAEKAGSQEERIQIELSLALAHGIHGEPEAIELFDRLRVEALERGAHQAAMRTYVNECAVAAANRDHATVDRLVPEALAFFEELQVLHPRDDVAGNFARSLLDRSRFDEAIEWALTAQTTPHRERGVAAAIEALARLRRGDPGLSDIPAEADVVPNDIYRYAMVMAAKAEAAWLRGDLDAAREHVRAGLGVEGVEQDSRALGDLALWAARCGEPVMPELERAPKPVRLELAGDWSAAIRAWEELGCDYDAALAALPADARAASRAAETLQRLGAVATARAFTRAREAAGASAPRGPRRSTLANPAGLTRREREVLDELASGATNAAIAAALHLSERTVAHHVSAVLRKLDMPTRTAAVAEAQRLGLLVKDGQEGAPR